MMFETPKVAYVTRYALTGGIAAHPIQEISSNGYVKVSRPGLPNGYEIYHDGTWFLSPEDAVKKADAMRTAKIASLKKQIAKLEKLTFTAHPPSPAP